MYLRARNCVCVQLLALMFEDLNNRTLYNKLLQFRKINLASFSSSELLYHSIYSKVFLRHVAGGKSEDTFLLKDTINYRALSKYSND